MEEPNIRHVRFFNGQFLREDEFREEQQYGNHMRRRLNYALFTDGVVEITTDDLKIVREPLGASGATPKQIRVKAGMAVGGNNTMKEAKEIILRRDSDAVDLSAAFTGGTVWVTVNYLRSEVSVPSTSPQPTRVDETAELRYHSTRPAPGAAAPSGEPLIIIGSVNFGSMSISGDDRQIARLRPGLLVPESSITINPATVTAGGTAIDFNIRSLGDFDLRTAVATGITITPSTGITPMPVNILAGTTRDNLTIRETIAATAPVGTRVVRVTLPGGAFEETSLTINAFVPLPTATFPGTATRNTSLTINGTNFVGTVSVTFPTGPGTTTSVSATVNGAQTQLTVTVPGTATSGNLTITAAGGSVTSPATVVIF